MGKRVGYGSDIEVLRCAVVSKCNALIDKYEKMAINGRYKFDTRIRYIEYREVAKYVIDALTCHYSTWYPYNTLYAIYCGNNLNLIVKYTWKLLHDKNIFIGELDGNTDIVCDIDDYIIKLENKWRETSEFNTNTSFFN